MEVRITKPALVRLKQISSYYRTKGKTAHFKNLIEDLRHKTQLLSQNPEMGQVEEHLKILEQGHRYIIVARLYKLIYIIGDSYVFITDIFDTRQDPVDINP